jgi:hypothetical protein
MRVRIGTIGRTASPLHPSGKVELAGQLHDARTQGLPLEADTPVVVIGGDSFGLLVRAIQPGEEPRVENSGKSVLTFAEGMKADEVKQQALRAHERRMLRRQEFMLAGTGALVGFLVWLGAMSGHDNHHGWPLALAIAVLGGMLVAPALHAAFILIGHEFLPLMAGGAGAGAIVGAMAGVPLFGLVGGMVAAIVGAFVMPIVLLLLYSMPEWM